MTVTEQAHATCEDCKQPMDPGVGCTMTHVSKGPKAPLVKRITYGAEADDWGAGERPCHDCNVGDGQVHHAGCDVERCPECGAQMLMCLGEPTAEEIELFGVAGCGWTHLAVLK